MVMQAFCPACHAEISVKPDQSIAVCLSCGKVIRIPDDLASAGDDSGGQADAEEQEQKAGAVGTEAGGDGAENSAETWGIPTDDMETEEAETNEMAEADEASLDASEPAQHDDPLERVPTTRFKRSEQAAAALQDEELLSDIDPDTERSVGQAAGAAGGSVFRFETTCPSCGSLMGIEGAEIPDTMTCPQCGASVDVAGQVSAMLASSGLRQLITAEDEQQLRAWLDSKMDPMDHDADGATGSTQDEEIEIVRTFCPSCRSLVSLDADLLVPGTLCPHCGKPLIPEAEDGAADAQGEEASSTVTSAEVSHVSVRTREIFEEQPVSQPSQVQVEVASTAGRSNSYGLFVAIAGAVILMAVALVGWMLVGTSGMGTSRTAGLPPVVHGRLTASGRLGHWVLIPTTCRSGRE